MTFSIRRPLFALLALIMAMGGSAQAAVPGAPTKVVALPGNARATVHFDPPASDGGFTITGYSVTSSPGGVVATGAAPPISVPTLVNGTQYTFTVRATNASGTGAASAASIAVTPILPTIAPAVATTESFALAVDAHGQVYAWGSDADGQLGQGRQLVATSPVQVLGLPAIQHIAVFEHVLAVDVSGQVWSWGDNLCAHLGPRDTPIAAKPSRLAGVTGMTKVAAGYCRSWALKADGTVWQLGVGSPVPITFPVVITDISAHDRHLLALGSDQRVYALGENSHGQLGVGHTNAVSQAVQVPGLANVTAISAGWNSSVALRSNGEVHYWGRYDSSQPALTSPTLATGLGGIAAAIAGGNYGYFLAARSDGTVWQWYSGPLSTPVQVSGMSGVSRLEFMTNAGYVVYGMSAGGALTANGANKNAELGQGHRNPVSGTVAVPGFASGAAQVATGFFSTAVLARKSDGTVWFWSENEMGQRGDGVHIGSSVPLAVPIPATIKRVSAADRFALALDTSGQVWGWGDNFDGPLNPDLGSRSTATPIAGISGVAAIAAGGLGIAAYAKTNGEAWVSGTVPFGPFAAAPYQVAGLANVVDVAASLNSVFYRHQNGTISALGGNAFGELGDGTTTSRTAPALVQGISGTVTKVVAAEFRIMALMSDGRVYAWGGTGTGATLTGGTNIPVLVPGVTSAVDVTVSRDGALIRLANGNLLGLGNTLLSTGFGSQTTPFAIAAFPQATQAFALGQSVGIAVGPTGLTWAWGRNIAGAIQGTVGDGTYVARSLPVVALAHDGNGGVDTNNWFLDLQPATAETVPAGYVPGVVATSRVSGSSSSLGFESTVKYKVADLGKKVNNYVLALVPPSFLGLVPTSAGVSSKAALAAKAARNGGYVLVQLTPAGWADVTGQLLPFSQGLASSAGTASNILNGIPASQILGSRFCVGYGESPASMLSSGTLREVLELEGAPSASSGVPCVLSGVYVGGPPSSVQGSGVTFTASVVGIAPGGTVQFRDGTAPLGAAVDLTGSNSAVSTAQYGTFSLALGTHSIGAAYSGDSVNPPAVSETARLHIVSAASQVAIEGLVSSELGREAAFVATVTGNNPGGSVQFRDGGASLEGPVPVAGGVATLRTSALGLGAHTITAAYLGDGQNAPSTSPALAHTVVDVLPTRVEIASSANPVNAGSPITITVIVSGTGATPAGNVTLKDWANPIESKPLTGGATSFTLGSLAGGVHAISAHYSGDNPPASSNTLFQEVSVPSGLVSVTSAKVGLGGGTINSNPAGIDCGATCTGTFLSGSPVALTAAPSVGSEFLGWYGAPSCGSNPVCTLSPGQATTVQATFQVYSPIPRLGNISTRMRVQTGDNVLIGGFIIGGSTPKQVAINARGPSMAGLPAGTALANPKIDLYSGPTIIASNDNWGSAANAAAIAASGFAPPNANESSILTTLNPGAYTAIVSGVGNTTGLGIVEVFGVDHPETPLINISTRGQVLTGDDVMIGGFIISGAGPQTVVVRARGPSLAANNIANPLMNPQMTLFQGPTAIASNDDWGTASNAAQIQASGFAPLDPRESAILITLQPGAYTAIVTGAGSTTGVAIIEVFKN